jgi:hypothetical protein
MVSTKKDENLLRWARLNNPQLQTDPAVAFAQDPLGKFLDNAWVKAVVQTPALTAEEYAAVLLELANDGGLVWPRIYDLCGGANLQLDVPRDIYMPLEDEPLSELRSWLATIVAREPSAMAALGNQLRIKYGGKIVALPAEARDGSESFRYIAPNIPEAIAFATRTLLVSELASRLCRCRYRECMRFFLVDAKDVVANRKNPQGRIRRDYCCTEHRVEEQRLSNKERQQKIRDDRKAARAAGNARKHK